MKLTNICITIFLLLIVGAKCENFELFLNSSEPRIPYKWGQMKRYRQILNNITKDVHFNETKEYEFPYLGHRTTYNMKIDNYEGSGENPCEIQSRYVDVEFDKLDTQLQKNYTYAAMHSFNSYLLVLTEDFKVILFIINQLPFTGIDIFPISEAQIVANELSPFDFATQNVTIASSYGGRFAHIFFPSVMYTLQVPTEMTNTTISLYKNTDYKFRKNVYASKYVRGYLFVSTGDDGIDVYKMDGSVSLKYDHVGNLNMNTLKLDYPMKAQDLAVDFSNRLYIVCPNNGIIIYEVHEADFSKSNVVHTIGMLKNSQYIAVRGDHTLVVTGMNDGESFITEVFYDIDSNEYFVNRQLISTEFKWTDVQMGDLFTFIQGKGYHRILYQGINKELIPQEDKHSDFRNGVALQEIDMYDVKQVEAIHQGSTSFIAISETGIYSIELQEVPPKLVCRADSRKNIGESSMRLVFNSTDCYLATFHSPILYNVWQMCQTDFYFTLNVHDIWIDGQNVSVATLVAVIIVLSFIILVFVLTFLYVSFRKKFQKTETELLDFKQKYMVLESRTNTQQQKDQSVIQDKSNLHFNNPNQLDTSQFK